MRDALELLDALDLVVARGRGVVDQDVLDAAARAVGRMRRRRGFRGGTLVMALIGGTGSGKSSLLNALAGEVVASVSHLRPHTGEPLAWIPAPPDPALTALLDDLGITQRRLQVRYPDVALLDLPDIDSVEEDHRRRVEALLPDIDGAIWVLDPEKYRDPGMHRDFLEPLSRYGDQFSFVLNKIDLVADADRERLRDDLRRVLVANGYPEPRIHLTAVAPARGLPLGLDGVRALLQDRMDVKQIERSKLIGNARTVLEHVASAARVWDGAAVGLEERWRRDRDAAAARVADDDGPGATEDALCRLEDLVAFVAGSAGPAYGAAVRSSLGVDHLEQVMAQARDAGIAAAADEHQSSRRRSRRAQATRGAIADVLDVGVGRPLLALHRRLAYFAATVAYAGVGVTQLERRG